MKRTGPYLPLLAIALLACGGSGKPESGNPGSKHSSGTGDSDVDIDTPVNSTLPAADAGAAVSSEPSSPVTFVLKNSGDESLFINMDKGFGAVIRAYSGKPPNAKAILMFPTHCTASCESAPEDVCPVCEEPKRAKDIKAAENHDEVAPGDSRRVEWDAMAFSYKKTRGANGKRCRCHEPVEPPPEDYTIQACGLRKTKVAKQASKYQCVTATLTLPVTDPVVVELDFGK